MSRIRYALEFGRYKYTSSQVKEGLRKLLQDYMLPQPDKWTPEEMVKAAQRITERTEITARLLVVREPRGLKTKVSRYKRLMQKGAWKPATTSKKESERMRRELERFVRPRAGMGRRAPRVAPPLNARAQMLFQGALGRQVAIEQVWNANPFLAAPNQPLIVDEVRLQQAVPDNAMHNLIIPVMDEL